MSKKIIIAAICLFAALIGLHIRNQRDITDFPVRLLEAIVKPTLVSSGTYKRLEYTISESPGINRVYVTLKFSSQNVFGAQLDSTATMTLVPEYMFIDALYKSPYADNPLMQVKRVMYDHSREYSKEAYDGGHYKDPAYFYSHFYIGNVVIGQTPVPLDKIEYFNSELLLFRGAGGYPNDIPKF
jgi:hypothetical protein